MADSNLIASLMETHRPIPEFPAQTPVAMAYVPYQPFARLYPEDKALDAGTLFEDLDKPFLGRRGCNERA